MQIRDLGSGMDKTRIRDLGWKKLGSDIWDGKNLDPRSGINILDPQHCKQLINEPSIRVLF
jgi:hypothetical protein